MNLKDNENVVIVLNRKLMFEDIIPVTLSAKAVEEVKNIMASKNIPKGYGLRIGIKGTGGCAGYTYLLGFDKEKDKDMSFTIEDIPVYVAKKDTMYLLGLEVDFYEGADARGFTFVKPESVKPEGS